MRTILTAIFFICIGSSMASAQVKKKAAQKEDENQIFAKVENEAHPDMAAWTRYLNQQAKLPDSVSKDIPPGCYTVVVTFIVDIYGGITEVKAEKDPGYGLGSMAVKAIRNYKGKWNPASQCGNLVKAYRKQPITYTIEAE